MYVAEYFNRPEKTFLSNIINRTGHFISEMFAGLLKGYRIAQIAQSEPVDYEKIRSMIFND